jgi:hypothetical protein
MATHFAFGKIVTDGLVLALDAGDRNSYVSGSTTWTDLSGRGFNCSMTGSVSYNNTPPQYFDYANLPNYFTGNSGLTSAISTAITITSWIKITNIADRSVLFDKYQTPTIPAGYGFEIGTLSPLWTNTIRFFAIGSTGLGWDPRGVSNALQQDVPTMVSITLDRTAQQFAMYVNDSSISYTQGGGTLDQLATDWATGTNVYVLGAFRPEEVIDSSFQQYNLSIYNRYLSAAEITQNYNAQKSRYGL